ncbi:MAG: membrane protein insertion efficiency factor YidD [Verrucomicrobiota bacterium]|nr:membrane protein insertion efficiency factor YidD [Verrucomicrobiota bacterium]
MKRCFIFLIDFYQAAISPFFGHCCRFTPTCSEYAKQAIFQHGVFLGSYKALRRLLRCHPFHPGGSDPVH